MNKGLVYIYLDEGFPYVNAASRYVLCEAKTIMHTGYEVRVVGLGMERQQDWNGDCGFYEVEGIRYENIKYDFKNITDKIFFGECAARHLKNNIKNAVNVRHVIVYSLSFVFVNSIKREIKKMGITVSFNLVEWCVPGDCRYGIFNLHYMNMWFCFNYLIKTKANVIVISRLLEEKFKKNGNICFVLPPLVDVDNYIFKPEDKREGRIKIIYPGIPAVKEAFDIMLKGLNCLSRDERAHLQFIMTGCSRKVLEDILGKDKGLLNDLSDCMIIYNFIPYDDLKKIYSKSHFLLLIRRKRRTTEANFPSKIPELMANGIAIIANRVGDYSDYIIDGENSIIVDGCTPENVVQSLRRVLDMDREKISHLSLGARMCAEEKFNYRNNRWTDGINAFIESCDTKPDKHENLKKRHYE